MSSYQAPIRDMKFLLQEVIGIDELNALPGYEDIQEEDVNAILEEASRFAGGVLDPLNQPGDKEGARFDNKQVFAAKGFGTAYKKFCESGWISLANEEQWGGQGLPRVLSGQTSEMWNAACMSFCLCPMLSSGVVHALTKHGTDEQKTKYLPNLVSGKWSGTMQLTEPQAGSDLSTVKTIAVPKGDHYLITGNKIYITWGDHDMVENVIHLVLARTPDSPQGVKGISLFIVPKFLVNNNGIIGDRNDVSCISIEKKLGIHASPTCVMAYGDDHGAIGYLVGEENKGLHYMFTMMNFARLEVGIEGLALSDRAYQRALSYSKERVQGKDLAPDAQNQRVAIIKHPDVRRMLMMMKAQTEAMRAICTLANFHLDHSLLNPDPGKRAWHQSMFDLLTPVVKGWCTEQSVEVASLGVQVHGGMGFIEETGAAQYLRDARITPIYEGTTGIQANDLIGRKIAYEGGRTINILLVEMQNTLDSIKLDQEDKVMRSLWRGFAQSLEELKKTVNWLVEKFPEDRKAVFAGSVPFLKLMGIVTGGWQLIKGAMIAHAKMNTDSAEDRHFYNSKIGTTLFYVEHVLNMSESLSKEIINGSQSTMFLKEVEF